MKKHENKIGKFIFQTAGTTISKEIGTVLMAQRLFFLVLIVISVSGCSSPEPARLFLRSNMRIVTDEKSDGEVLRMKPVDLYRAFDVNVTKKWKKIHENSWMLIIGGKDPVTKMKTKMVFTLTMVPQLNSDVIITKLEVNGEEY
ncbi:MAG: hypothetical protein HOC71_00215, partial [Candidatus Latescibacteria bacterium]|nr:hypothetical protein [Candidatus Latescibacterota bacterium]